MKFEKLTTAYDPVQDRFCLSVCYPDGSVVGLWLTARVVRALVPPLLNLLSRDTTAHTREGSVQSWQQSNAKAAHAPLQKNAVNPVPAAKTAGKLKMYLIHDIGISAERKKATLIFKIANNEALLELPLTVLALRQWLGVVYRKSERAGWALNIWPAWMVEAENQVAAPPADSAILH